MIQSSIHYMGNKFNLLPQMLPYFPKNINRFYDLFGGSGSTLIACEQTNRNCLMMEYAPKDVDVIIQRWENFTGEKAIKLN